MSDFSQYKINTINNVVVDRLKKNQFFDILDIVNFPSTICLINDQVDLSRNNEIFPNSK